MVSRGREAFCALLAVQILGMTFIIGQQEAKIAAQQSFWGVLQIGICPFFLDSQKFSYFSQYSCIPQREKLGFSPALSISIDRFTLKAAARPRRTALRLHRQR
jgi:hypothetical protein